MVGKCSGLAFGFGLATAAVTIATALALGAVPTRPAKADGELPGNLTFEGEREQGTTGPPDFEVLSGTVSLTLTADRSGIVRAEITDFDLYRPLPDTRGWYVPMSGELYYDPPAPITDGQFEVSVPINLFGEVRTHVELQGTFASDTEASGTATWLVCGAFGCQERWGSAGFDLEGPVDTPPGPDDAVHVVALEGDKGSAGTLVMTTDADGNLTSFALKGVSSAPCKDADSPLNVHAFFEPAQALDEGVTILLSRSGWLHGLRMEGAVTDAGTLAGTLRLGRYYSDCRAELNWTIEDFQPTATARSTATSPPPTPTPPPTPAVSRLPDTGSGAATQPANVPAWIAATGVLALALGLGGSATWRKRFS